MNRATTFVRVVETGGFTRAAESMGLPPSSISRSVARLEEELGVTLLERTTRKVSLTDAGKAFFERAREALAGLEEANALALDAAREAHGVVRVALPPEFGANAGGLYAPFLAKHPRIRIELTFTTRGAELVGDLVDLAVQIGRLPDSSLIARRIGGAMNKLYASPAYLEQRGVPRKLADLTKHDAILFRALGGEARWELEGPNGADHVDVSGRVVGDSLQFVSDAAIAGLGIALLCTFMGEREVTAGRLVNVLPKFGAVEPAHVLAHGSRHLPRRVALVRDHMVESMTRECAKH
ncbi:MAG TPA: LysR family transcriptional regulator [Kofleriaceae bacterium]